MAPSPPKTRFLTPLIALLLLAAGLAGCLSGDDADVLGTFYPMTFLAQEIAGDAVDVAQIIPEGTEPHEWDPGVRDLTRLSDAQLVVAQGMDFETWLDSLLANLGDRAPRAVYTGDNLDFQAHGPAPTHALVEGLSLIDRSIDQEVAEVDGDHWHGALPYIPHGDRISIGALFTDHDGNAIPIGEDQDYQVNARLADDALDIVSFNTHGDHIHIYGDQEGETQVIFQLWHDDHADWESPPLTVHVGDDHSQGQGGDHGGHGDVDKLELIDRSIDAVVADVHGDHWHGELPDIPHGDRISVGALFTDHDGHEIPLGEDLDYRVNARLADGAPEIVSFNTHGDHIHIYGDQEGETQVIFQLWHDDHADWESPPLTVHVGDDHSQGQGGDHADHGDPEELILIDRSTGEEIADVHGNHWHGGLPGIPVGDRISIGALFYDDDGNAIPIGDDKTYQFTARLAAGSENGIVEVESHGDHIHIHGLAIGEVRLVFQLWHDDHADWESPPLTARVLDDDTSVGPFDPHTWTDPVLFAQQALIVRDAMISAFPQHAATFRDNAQALVERLDELHHAYEQRLRTCETRNVIVQHNAFAYLGERYDFQVHSVVGLSPQAEPNPRAVAQIIEKTREHDVNVVFTETLASPTVMNSIASETGAEVQVLNPMERRSPQEREAGLDFIDIMYNNLDALADAMRCSPA